MTQPVLYTVFASRQALIDAIALAGFAQLAHALEQADLDPLARMRAYLHFAETHPRVYDAMFSMYSGLAFAANDTPEPLHRAFDALRVAFPDVDDSRAEVAWSTLHGLATLQSSGRLLASRSEARLDLAHRLLAKG